jgi:tRNA dimethylallyltransferase
VPISVWQAEAEPLPFATFVVGLRREREDHRAAIAARVRRMVESGLVEEVRRLRGAGLDPSCQAYRTIGVPEAARHLDGETSVEEMTEEIIHRTWNLVRRQSAWFRREEGVSWWDVTGLSAGEVADEIVTAWRLVSGDER